VPELANPHPGEPITGRSSGAARGAAAGSFCAGPVHTSDGPSPAVEAGSELGMARVIAGDFGELGFRFVVEAQRM